MMGPKLRELKERCPNDPLLSGEFTKELQDRLDSWKDERNELMHAMADASVPIEEIDRSAEALAKTGAKLVRDYCSLCRRIKKRLKSSTP